MPRSFACKKGPSIYYFRVKFFLCIFHFPNIFENFSFYSLYFMHGRCYNVLADGIPRWETVPNIYKGNSFDGNQVSASPFYLIYNEVIRLKIGFTGAGKVGCSLGRLFAQGGIWVTGYYSWHLESAHEAATFTQTRCYDSLSDLARDSDALFLTVPDDKITVVYRQLIQSCSVKGKYICHCSGAMTAEEAFPGAGALGAKICSIHPLFPVSSKLTSYRELPDAFFCLEGDTETVNFWAQQLEVLGLKTQRINAESKVRYHAACAVVSNLVCGLAGMGLSMLESCGFTETDARRALSPLMRSNLEHILQDGPAAALTGPAERCDIATVEKHIQCFSAEDQRALYCAATAALIPLAEQKHPEQDYDALKKLLKDGGKINGK